MRTERILFIRTDRMGDVLMNLAAIRRIRQNFPKVWLSWMVDRSVAPLLRNHPDVDELIETDALALAEEGSYRRALTERVRRARFDIGIASNASKFLHWMLFSARIPVRAGWRRKWGFLLNRSLPDRKASAARHEIDSNLDLAGLIAPQPWDGSWHLPVDERAYAAVEKRLSKELGDAQSPVVAVHAGTSDPAKRWPLERFAEVCAGLARRTRVVLIGGSEEEAESRRLASRLPEGVLDWTGAIDLQELSAFLRSPRVKTLLSVDSGPVHVAWLHGKPVVVLFAQNAPGSDPRRWGPRSAGSITLHKPIGAITAAEVSEALEKVLSQ